ncbi:MAG: ABC transporter permease [Bdellovibrio sp.]|nr:ABC transporter permease [Bdellovibrio sp.]
MRLLRRVQIGQVLKPVFSVALGLTLGLLVTKIAGEDPWHVFKILVNSAFGSRYDLGMTLVYATPLIFTGLSVAFAFHAGLFNIGAEGQLAMGAFAAAAIGYRLQNLPPYIAPLVATLGAALAGGIWGGIPGWLRAKRGSHEVINTIMLNFVAAGCCGWATIYLIPNLDSQNPETGAVGANFMIPHFAFFGEAPVSFALPLALLVAFGFWFFLWRTVTGFEVRAVGQNESAARAAGIDASKVRILSLFVAGALAGLVGVGEVLGTAGRFKLGFSPGYGFIGIAVALLGRNRPIGIVLAALLFGALHKGTSDLDLETENVTRDISLILQAAVILCVSSEGVWDLFLKRGRKKEAKNG